MTLTKTGPAPQVFITPAHTLIIGCGNLLRGDDAVGPILIRHLWERGLPDGVRCADAGTGGMDVAFQMRGVDRVILIDACSTGAEPGALYKVPGRELELLPPVTGIHLHAFRWDHALAFARWLLKDEYPRDVTVYLIEAAQLTFGEPLSSPAERTMHGLATRLLDEVNGLRGEVELTENGSLHLDAAFARRHFPNDLLVPLRKSPELWLMPTRGAGGGGLLLKQRNKGGDRGVVIWEHLPPDTKPGRYPAIWDAERGALRVALKAGA